MQASSIASTTFRDNRASHLNLLMHFPSRIIPVTRSSHYMMSPPTFHFVMGGGSTTGDFERPIQNMVIGGGK